MTVGFRVWGKGSTIKLRYHLISAFLLFLLAAEGTASITVRSSQISKTLNTLAAVGQLGVPVNAPFIGLELSLN